jgi:hypothetical protein
MRDEISIFTRTQKPPLVGQSEPRETYTDFGTNPYWADITTFAPFGSFQGGERSFDKVAPRKVTTHLMTMRYIEGLTKQHWIKWEDDYFEIDKLVNPEDRDEYWEIYAIKRGDSALKANG